jgi:serine protease Do
MQSFSGFSRITAGVLIASGMAAGLLSTQLQTTSALAQDKPSAEASEGLKHAYGLSEAFKTATRKVVPSVVHITSTTTVQAGGGGAMPDEDMLRRFFGDMLPDDGTPFRFEAPEGQPREFQREGTGSGVIVRDSGFILTNNHVVAEADELLVRLQDGREYEAKVVGTDPETDLAVIKIEADSLTAAELGDSAAVEQGDWVLAVGSPFGLDHTVTAGIVSAKGRQIGIIRERNGMGFEDFIQTDAAINPGNSGGPLVDLQGNVIGINTAISTRTGSYQGVGFAIPSDMARVVMNSIIEKGRVERGWLGISVQPLTPELAESFGFKSSAGVLVGGVMPETPAAKAGLKNGDIITAIDGKAVANPTELVNTIAALPPGQKVELEVFRGGKFSDVSVDLGLRPLPEAVAAVAPARGESTTNIGMTVESITPELAQRFNVEESAKGVLVTQVDANSVAANAGVRPGDLIQAVNDSEISDTSDFKTAMSEADLDKGIRMHVISQGSSRYVFIREAAE